MNARAIGKSLNVLIAGGGCAGPSLAYWLARSGHNVTVVERSPNLRDTGAQIDVRGQGIEALRRMGLLDEVNKYHAGEDGLAFVDAKGRRWATFMANTTGKGAQSFTSEYEIMRGDLVRILYEATKDDVNYVFGKTVDRFDQDPDRVRVHFSDGCEQSFDLLVGAEGQGSRIRRDILPPGEPEPYAQMGVHVGYWFVPRDESDSSTSDMLVASRGRAIMRRNYHDKTQIYAILRETSDEASAIHRASRDRQHDFWADRFRNAGWQTARFLNGMAESEFFYSLECVQVRASAWGNGRVVTVGDAAYCASPISGLGTTGALVGAYVLAEEINKSLDNIPRALANYETTMRPYARAMQATVNPKAFKYFMPMSRLGVATLLSLSSVASFFRLTDLVASLSKNDRDGSWRLPEPAAHH